MATYSDKLNRLKKALEQRTGLSSLVPGTKAFQIIESVAYEQMQLEYKIEEYVNRVSLLTATGGSLDKIGENFLGIKRLGEVEPFVTESMKAIKFYVSTGIFGDINKDATGTPQSIVIPEGTMIEGKIGTQPIRLRVSKVTVLPFDASEKYIAADFIQGQLATIPAGALKIHNFTGYTLAINNILKVTNPMPIASGRQRETDENYKFRLVNGLKAFPKTTTPGVHEIVTTTPGVSSVFIEQAANGGGSFNAFVQGITPITSDEVIVDVKSRLNEVIGPWVVYQVLKPNYIGLTMSIELRTFGSISNLEYITSVIVDKISEEVNNFYGPEFFVNSLLRIATNAHANISSAAFNYVHTYTGSDDIRGFSEIDLEADLNPVLYLSSKEKLIIEPIINSIAVMVA